MFPDLGEMMKKAGDAKAEMEKNHKVTVKVLEEIRDLLKEIATALKGE